jgi:4-amino-4-deoxy-L-arabinose transferase-like glycosyltransferase
VLNSETVEPNPSTIQPENVSVAAKVGWTVLILATLYVCYFSHLGAIGFVGPDEPRYAWIARDMVETGDWVTPRLYGKPWFEKPVLYYWGAALSFKLFGVSEAAARLPSAISALLATLALAWLALRIYGTETARWLLLLLPTTVGMIGFSHAAATDMPFSAMLTIAMVCAAVVLRLVPAAPHSDSSGVVAGLVYPVRATPDVATPQSFSSAWPALILFGFFLGLAVLAKGPAAILLSGGAVLFWALFTRRWRDAFRLFHPAALASFCLTALPWYFLCARRNPDFFRIFIIEHNFKRYLTPEFQHIQPFWYYGPILFIALFPWIGMTFSAVICSFREQLGMRLDAISIFALGWGVFPLLFFSTSKSKLPGYILPAIPAFILLTAFAMASQLKIKRVPVPAGFAVIALTPVVVITAISLAVSSIDYLGGFGLYGTLGGFLSFFALTVVLVLASQKMHQATVLSGVLAWICFALLTNRVAIPRLEPRVSARSIAQKVLDAPDIQRNVETFRLRRDFEYELDFYLHRQVVEWDASDTSPRYVVASLSGMLELDIRRIPYEVLSWSGTDATLLKVGSSARGPG